MVLPNDLITEFAKLTTPVKETNRESTHNATIVDYNGEQFAKIDGSELLTPINKTTSIKNGERVMVMIKNHTATVIGNMTSPSPSSSDIDEVVDQVTKVEILVADKVSTSDFDAQVGRIDTLFSDNVIIKDTVTANTALINDITAANVVITDRLTVAEAAIEDLDATKVDADIAEITYAKISDLEATDADIQNLRATYASFEVATTNRLTAIDATIDNLDSTYATIVDLNVERARIDELEATNADITNLEAEVADINTLMFGSASGDVIQSTFSNAVIASLSSAQIKSAMIESVSAAKITSGDIITNNVRVKSEDGKLLISDETIQISDDSRVRVQIGKDGNNDYSINIWDTSGNLMFSEGGISDSAIKDAIIRDDMVSDTANISAHKLNIDSLFEEINDSTKTIKSSRVYLDDEGQTLDVVFTDLSSDVDALETTVSSQGTELSIVQGQISSKVWQQDIDTASDVMNTRYSSLEQTVDSINLTIADHTSMINEKAEAREMESVVDQIIALETNLSGFKSTVSSTYATKNALNNTTNIASQAYEKTALQSDVTNYAQLNSDTASKWGFSVDEEAADGVWYIMNTLSRDKFISGWHDCNGGERFRISFEISTSCKGNSSNGGTDSVYRGTAIGLYGYDATGKSVGITYTDRVMATAEATPTKIEFVAAVNANARKFRIFIQTESFGNFSGSIKVRNIRVEKIDKTLETIVVSNRSRIDQHDDSISAAVTRISTNETDISSLRLTAAGLTSRVTNTEKDTETALINAANAQSDIDNLEIGGRNLFENSGKLSTGAIGQYFAPETPPYTITMEEDSTAPGGSCAMCAIGEIATALTNGGFYLSGQFGNYISKMVAGETYTVSVWIKGSRNIAYGAITAEFLKNSYRQDTNNLTTEWQRFIVTGVYNGNTTSSVAITFYYNSLIQSNDVFYIAAPKIEKGNKATDWTCAPEDMATADDLDAIQSSIDSTDSRVGTVESLIQQLSESISMLITDGNGESMMMQTANGWTFSTGEIQNAVNSALENLAELADNLGSTDSTVDSLKQAVTDLGVLNDYVKIGTYEDEPCIELGESDSNFKLIITNTRIMFMEGSGVPAYINNQSLFIKKAVIQEELQQGEFVWKARANGNLGLIWKGATS